MDANQENWQLTAPSAVELRRLGWSSNSLFVGEMVEVQAERQPGNGNIAQVKRITRANGALLLTGLEQEEPSSAFADVPDGFYTLDPRQAHLFFSFNHLGFSDTPVKVERLSGTVRWNKEAPESSAIQLDLDVSSLRSGVTVLDEALRGPDFFDFLNHPSHWFQ
ncbi:MAG: YceI family protein [Porticoccaceae bacterium]